MALTKPHRKGNRIEQKVIDLFEAIGGRCIRSAGSHGPFDIVVFLGSAIFLLQIKANRKPSAVEIETMKSWHVAPNVTKAYVVWKDRTPIPDFWWEYEWRE